MTKSEHQLMVSMFTAQLKLVGALIGILREKGLLGSPEYKELMRSASSLGAESQADLASVQLQYAANAKILEVDTGFEE